MNDKPTPIPFEQLREFFEDEDAYGQLCDITAPDADGSAWAVFLRDVVPMYKHHFSLVASGGDKAIVRPLPQDPRELLLLVNSEAGPWPRLELEIADFEARVLFCAPDWLEVDVWRSEVTAERYAGLAELMRRMGDAMGLDVFMTPECHETEGVMVYEAKRRLFRRPRHGDGTDGDVRMRMFSVLREALGMIDGPAAAGRKEPTLPALRSALERIDAVEAEFRELVLQDELTIEDRRAFKRAASLVRTIVSPAPGSGAEEYRGHYWRELLELIESFRR